MKLTQKQVEGLILEIAGEEGLAVYRILKGKVDVNEFLIAEKLKLTINQIRNTFYKFQAYNLVTSISRKDRKKGWYIYLFTFNARNAGSAYLRLKKEKLAKLKQRVNKEKAHQFYTCPNKDMRATLENAMEHNFICIECGQLLVPENNVKAIVKFEQEIDELNKDINDLEKQDIVHIKIEELTEIKMNNKKTINKKTINKKTINKKTINKKTIKTKNKKKVRKATHKKVSKTIKKKKKR